ncbi:coiled-coil domain-containing protein 174 [Pieris brassicae]|uniref:coiled-coil domain-containing protein 174 n=1 Tax=Pieris brassicae TaxID=7116 RepID=UPI001E65E415|nr:coiled-coil domain-containing protein 174 [Pieris brassicae]
MNEHSKKTLTFNKSTLFSLKAELLKKQEEVLEKKNLPKHRLENYKPVKVLDKNKHESNNTQTLKSKLKAIDTDELEAQRKSKCALEKKAELYEHLANNAGHSELAGRFLVDFKEKKQQGITMPDVELTEVQLVEKEEKEDGDWIEFTDCLGRTRKCLKSDLDFYKKRDKELMKRMPGFEEDESDMTEKKAEHPFLVQKTKDYLQSLRQKWEEKEKELLAKDQDIHYQDILFDEARMHGVGYYAFSTDETERKKQIEQLMKEREETIKAQKQAEELRKKRDELVAARVAAAKARQRMRLGLPPEDPEDKQNEFRKCLIEFLNEKKTEADNKANEEEKRLKEEREKERQKERAAYIREWDLGKEGVDDKVTKFRVMTQEEYVEKQRAKRINEFAPLEASTSRKSKFSFDTQGSKVNTQINMKESDSTKKKTWADVRQEVRPLTPPPLHEINDLNQKGLYFSSKKSENSVKYKNFVKSGDPIPIQNELSDEEDNVRRHDKRHNEYHSEIAPPPTYDYYGPEPKISKHQKPFESDIRESFAQGTKSLETKSTGIHLPKHYDFTFD